MQAKRFFSSFSGGQCIHRVKVLKTCTGSEMSFL